mgnify:CR=1 FL=1|jgi:YhcH/YjgK/YiaL family protein
MIYDKISNAKLYAGISAAMAVAMEVLETTDFAAVAPGSYQVREGVYYNVMEPMLRPVEEGSWECHRKYADVQYVLVEGEQDLYTPADRVQWGEYNEGSDVTLAKLEGDYVSLPMHPDTFAVFFPGDAHAPTLALNEVKQVKKVVIKVPV